MGSTAAAALLFFLAVVPAVLAVTFQVGDTSGWNTGVDYTTWVRGKTFRVGDTLEFKYGPAHSVSVVDKSAYDNCDGSNTTQNFFDRDTKINLTRVGTIYFLCPTPGHCLGGMKLAVRVLATTSSPPKTGSPLPSASPPESESPTPSPSPSQSMKNAAPKAVMSYGKIVVTMVLIYGLMS